jgi:hypothetical protein
VTKKEAMTEHSARIHPASPPHWPTATYRWQFNHQFTFAQAAALVDYLHELGLSNVYASPDRAKPSTNSPPGSSNTAWVSCLT